MAISHVTNHRRLAIATVSARRLHPPPSHPRRLSITTCRTEIILLITSHQCQDIHLPPHRGLPQGGRGTTQPFIIIVKTFIFLVSGSPQIFLQVMNGGLGRYNFYDRDRQKGNEHDGQTLSGSILHRKPGPSSVQFKMVGRCSGQKFPSC